MIVRSLLPAARGCPGLGWDLNLYPKQLHAAYWQDKDSKYTHGDIQVAGFLLVVLTLSIFRNACVQAEPRPNVWASIPAWLVLAAWLLLASRRPNTYRQHRTLFVLLFKTLLAATVLHLTNDGGRMVGSSPDQHSSTVLLVKATSLHGLVHLPALCVGLPLPFWLQLGWVLGRTIIFCLGRASRELVSVATTPAYLEGVASFNSLWVRLVQSGSHTLVVNGSTALQDRCTAMTVALLTMHLSAAALSMYLAYIAQWVQVRAWLRQHAVGGPTASVLAQQEHHAQPQHERRILPAASASQFREVGGVLLTPRQLAGMCRSHAAALLLDGRGLLGRASMACFHACAVNLILLGVLLLSRLLVLVVGPHVLPGPLLRAYYPPALGLEGGVCRLEDEPRLGGFWGSLLFLLGV